MKTHEKEIVEKLTELIRLQEQIERHQEQIERHLSYLPIYLFTTAIVGGSIAGLAGAFS